MKWFKHKIRPLTDDAYLPFYKKHGLYGHGVFFAIYELMAQNFNISTPGQCLVYKDTILKYTDEKWDKLQPIIKDMSMIRNEKGIYATFDGDNILLRCPMLKEIADEYTTRELKRIGSMRSFPKKEKKILSGDTPDNNSDAPTSYIDTIISDLYNAYSSITEPNPWDRKELTNFVRRNKDDKDMMAKIRQEVGNGTNQGKQIVDIIKGLELKPNPKLQTGMVTSAMARCPKCKRVMPTGVCLMCKIKEVADDTKG